MKTEGHRHSEDSYVAMEAETGERQLQVRQCQGSQATTRSWRKYGNNPLSEPPEGTHAEGT